MIRLSRPGDESALQHLWQVAFGDTPEAIATFHRELYRPGDALIWAEGDTIASAIYLLDAGIMPWSESAGDLGRPPLRASYSYALATLPAYRGQGLGTLLTKAAISRSVELGFDCNLICPAEETLFAYYIRLGYSGILPIAEGELSCSVMEDFSFRTNIMSTNIAAYPLLRTRHLPALAVTYPESFFQYLAQGLASSGGGLYRLELENQTGCAAVERRGDSLFVREILPAALAERGTQALMAHLGAKSAIFRTVPDDTLPLLRCRPFVLVAPADELSSTKIDGYFPFVLD